MGIAIKICYAVRCGRCGALCGDETSYWDDKYGAMSIAEQSGWREISGDWYCPECYKVDEETDDYVVKTEG